MTSAVNLKTINRLLLVIFFHMIHVQRVLSTEVGGLGKLPTKSFAKITKRGVFN